MEECAISFASLHVLGGIPLATISVSSLTDSARSSASSSSSVSNASLDAFEEQLNQQAANREYLMEVLADLQVTTSNALKLQSTTLVQLTSSTTELTRTALVSVHPSLPAGRRSLVLLRRWPRNDVYNWLKHCENCPNESPSRMYNSSAINFTNARRIFSPFVSSSPISRICFSLSKGGQWTFTATHARSPSRSSLGQSIACRLRHRPRIRMVQSE